MRFSLLASAALLSFNASAAAQETVTYTYDALGRLVATSTNGGANNGTTSAYSYDAASNRTNVTVSASGGGTPTPTPTPSCSFAIADGSNNYESTVWMQVNRTGTCAGTVTLNFQMAENGSPYTGNSYPSTGAVSFSTSDTYKLIPVSHYGWTGTVLVTISLASGSATITRATGTAQFYE